MVCIFFEPSLLSGNRGCFLSLKTTPEAIAGEIGEARATVGEPEGITHPGAERARAERSGGLHKRQRGSLGIPARSALTAPGAKPIVCWDGCGEVAGVSPLEGEAERRGVRGWSEGKAFPRSVGVGSALTWTQLSWSVVR